MQYTIRVSSKAKYMRLNVSLQHGLVVVVPKTMTQRQINRWVPEFIDQKRDWITKTMTRLENQPSPLQCIGQCPLPDIISLPAIGKVLTVNYRERSDEALSIGHENDDQLMLSGRFDDKPAVFKTLQHHLKLYAVSFLKHRLNTLSSQLNLPYNRLTVRAQKTRWGSCSGKKNINLNYRLLFIESELVDYILVHELVHTIHMNHSVHFWRMLEQFIPDAREKDKAVNRIALSLPCWIYY
jgi:predicted metal-dependent hydrolase